LGTLSKGWRQRTWLAQALVGDPPVLILDEPTDGLDPVQKTDLRALLIVLKRSKAILMSTHILEEAEVLCDRVLVMARGGVVADAAVAELADGAGRLADAFSRLAAESVEP
jgi:ABC-2 type transport system ATP-binding protein